VLLTKEKKTRVYYFISTMTESLYVSTNFTSEGSFTSLAEGPAVDEYGNLYAVGFSVGDSVGKISTDSSMEMFFQTPKGSMVNGIRFSSKEDMFLADYVGHNILKIDMDAEIVKHTVFAHDHRMNQPNDIAIMDNDIMFASDPDWASSTGQLWRIAADGVVTFLEGEMGTTNGIEVSPDQKKLYVNESNQRNIWMYSLDTDGLISNKTLFHKFDSCGMDGMRCDTDGNLFITRHGCGRVDQLSPDGTVLREIPLLGELPTNIAFGGKDGKTAYVTVADKGWIETFRVEQPGRSWSMRQGAKNASLTSSLNLLAFIFGIKMI